MKTVTERRGHGNVEALVQRHHGAEQSAALTSHTAVKCSRLSSYKIRMRVYWFVGLLVYRRCSVLGM